MLGWCDTAQYEAEQPGLYWTHDLTTLTSSDSFLNVLLSL